MREWILKNWTLFEEEDGELNPDIFEAAFNAFGKKQVLYGKKSIEQDRWINEIFGELDEIRKSDEYFDLRTGKLVTSGKRQNPKSKSMKKVKKVAKKSTKKVKKTKRIVKTGRPTYRRIAGENAAGGLGTGFGFAAGHSFGDWLFD